MGVTACSRTQGPMVVTLIIALQKLRLTLHRNRPASASLWARYSRRLLKVLARLAAQPVSPVFGGWLGKDICRDQDNMGSCFTENLPSSASEEKHDRNLDFAASLKAKRSTAQ